ncbi:Os06g0267200, partial [Oryza sativa Japonica Group]
PLPRLLGFPFPIRSRDFLRVSTVAAPPWVLHRSPFPSPDRYIPFTRAVSIAAVSLSLYPVEPKSLPSLISTQSSATVVLSHRPAILSRPAGVHLHWLDTPSPTGSTGAHGCRSARPFTASLNIGQAMFRPQP